jgi:SNF2 family DNA or RNA helicase
MSPSPERRVLVPNAAQRAAIPFLVENKRCNLWAGMGLGKTIAALLALDAIALIDDDGSPTLAIGPLPVARDTWIDEVGRWDCFKHINCVPIIGNKRNRLAAVKLDAPLFTTNYEQLPWLVAHFEERWPFKKVIADESTRLKNFRMNQGGMRAHQLGRVAHSLVDRWINLTGTPAPNGLKDLWGQNWYVDKGKRLGRTHTAFMERWFGRSYDGRTIVPFPHAQAEIGELLRDISLTLDPKDYFDIKDPLVRERRVKLPPDARKIFDNLADDMYHKFEDATELEIFNAAALTQKCLQVANGGIYIDNPVYKVLHQAKIEALESIHAEAGGMPLLVVFEFNPLDVDMIKRAFPRAVELNTKRGMAAFKAGDSDMGLAHAGSLGHGVDGLQHVTNIAVYYGHNWNHEQRTQVIERIGPMRQLQGGYDRPVWLYNIIADDSLDDLVIQSHSDKRTVQEILKDAAKRRKH